MISAYAAPSPAACSTSHPHPLSIAAPCGGCWQRWPPCRARPRASLPGRTSSARPPSATGALPSHASSLTWITAAAVTAIAVIINFIIKVTQQLFKV